jgi:hypothetical protein
VAVTEGRYAEFDGQREKGFSEDYWVINSKNACKAWLMIMNDRNDMVKHICPETLSAIDGVNNNRNNRNMSKKFDTVNALIEDLNA